MIFLSGSINELSQSDQQQEADFYQQKGWALKDPTTHDVRIMIEDKDLDGFIEYLRALPLDKKPRVWKDRNGTEHVSETVSFRLKGTQMAGNWVKLRAAIKTQQDLSSPAHQQPRQTPQVRPQAAAAAATAPIPSQPVPNAAPAQWDTAPVAAQTAAFDEDIPF